MTGPYGSRNWFGVILYKVVVCRRASPIIIVDGSKDIKAKSDAVVSHGDTACVILTAQTPHATPLSCKQGGHAL